MKKKKSAPVIKYKCNWCGNDNLPAKCSWPCFECNIYYFRDSLLSCNLINEKHYVESEVRYLNTFKNKRKEKL